MEPAPTKNALFAQQAGQAIVNNLAAPTRYNAWPASSGDLTQCLTSRKLEGADKAKASLECPASHSSMAKQATLQM